MFGELENSLERKILHSSFPYWLKTFKKKTRKWMNDMLNSNLKQDRHFPHHGDREWIHYYMWVFISYILRLFLRYMYLILIILSFNNKCSVSFLSIQSFFMETHWWFKESFSSANFKDTCACMSVLACVCLRVCLI